MSLKGNGVFKTSVYADETDIHDHQEARLVKARGSDESIPSPSPAPATAVIVAPAPELKHEMSKTNVYGGFMLAFLVAGALAAILGRWMRNRHTTASPEYAMPGGRSRWLRYMASQPPGIPMVEVSVVVPTVIEEPVLTEPSRWDLIV